MYKLDGRCLKETKFEYPASAASLLEFRTLLSNLQYLILIDFRAKSKNKDVWEYEPNAV